MEGNEERITFLYKLTQGACPKSYGFNVAQLAGLPSPVISLAREKATSCEREARHIKLLRYEVIIVCIFLHYYFFAEKLSVWTYPTSNQ